MTPKQERFAAAMANGATASAAYRQAYDTSRMTAKTVHNRSYELAHNGEILGRIENLQAAARAAVEEATSVDLQRILFENARVAFSDVGQLYDEDGRLIPVHKLPEDVRRSIASIEVVALFGQGKDGVGQIGHTKKIKLWNKNEALDRLMKHFGGYEKDNNQKADALANIPREVLKMMEQRLLGLSAPASPRRRQKPA